MGENYVIFAISENFSIDGSDYKEICLKSWSVDGAVFEGKVKILKFVI
jgi:hypothetical protein